MERASEHTAQAEALDRDPRIYLKREDYQRALKDPGSYAGQLLRRSYDMMGRAQARAEEMLAGFREALSQSVDRLDGLLAMLRGEERLVPSGITPSSALSRSGPDVPRSEGGNSAEDDLDRALDALRRGREEVAGSDPQADAAARARQAVEDEERRRADELARQEAEAARAREIGAEAERERTRERERDEPEHKPRDRGHDFER